MTSQYTSWAKNATYWPFVRDPAKRPVGSPVARAPLGRAPLETVCPLYESRRLACGRTPRHRSLGGDERIRTADLCLAKAALSQLSHIPVDGDTFPRTAGAARHRIGCPPRAALSTPGCLATARRRGRQGHRRRWSPWPAAPRGSSRTYAACPPSSHVCRTRADGGRTRPQSASTPRAMVASYPRLSARVGLAITRVSARAQRSDAVDGERWS